MRSFKRILAFLCLLTVLVPLFSSCGGANKERMNDTSDTLYIGHVGTSFPSSYMPWQSRDGIAPTISSMIYSTLFSQDDATGDFLPNLAKEWCYIAPDGTPLVTDDGKVDYDALERYYGSSGAYIPVKVTLHDNATWSDGTPVTVEDVYFSFDLCADSSRSNHAGALAWVADLNHEYQSGMRTKNGLYTAAHNPGNKYSFAEGEEDTVIYLHTKKVLGAITSLFTTVLILPEHLYGPIVNNPDLEKREQVNSTDPSAALKDLYMNPVGCGPFTLDTAHSNAQVIVLDRREDYHLKDGDDYLYKVDKLKFILYQEQNVAIFSILNGYIDVLDSSVNPNYSPLFEKEENIVTLRAGGTYAETLVLNLNPTTEQTTPLRSLFKNVNFRKAIALAIDQEHLIKNVQGGAATTFSMGLVSSAQTDIYNPLAHNILGSDYTARIAEANRLLDEICPEKDKDGYRLYEGKRVCYEILGSPGEQDLISFLQVQLQKIGVEVKYAPKGSTPENTYLYSGKFDMTLQGVSFTASTADIMMNSHFVNLGKSSNYGRLQDEEMKEKIDEMRTTINRNTKYELLKELQVEVAEQYYKIPLYCSQIISVARSDRYTGWIAPTGGTCFSTESLQNLQRVQ